MALKIAINGFGRIGRTILRAGMKERGLKFVAVNDLTDIPTLVHLLKHDTVYGRLDEEVKTGNGEIIVDGHKLKVFAEKDPSKLPWKALGVDIVIESTGIFTTKEQAEMHLKAGAKKVIISAPAKGNTPVKTIVPGVNDNILEKTDQILSNASCTTNCLAPMLKVLNDSFGIEKGFMTTVHAMTADQHLVDAPHKDLRRGKSASVNIVPTTTGAAKAIGLVIPELKGKMDGIAVRVPVIDGSLTDLSVLLKKEVTKSEINSAFFQAAKKQLKDVLEYSEDELVSTDVIGNTHGCVFDSKFTKIIDPLTEGEKQKGNFIKILGWYDNEFGYCNQLIKLIKIL
jgi:glyceraldehyde 3-phosphate dehydrogenase